MNQLKPILIEDFNEIKSPSGLQYSPDEKTLAFTLVQPDKENNKYLLIKAELDDKYLDAVCHKNASKVVKKAGV